MCVYGWAVDGGCGCGGLCCLFSGVALAVSGNGQSIFVLSSRGLEQLHTGRSGQGFESTERLGLHLQSLYGIQSIVSSL
jgi:hypothetical protein